MTKVGQMINETDVIMAYRLIMGREPENQRVIEEHAGYFQDLRALRAGFMASDEFRTILGMPVARVDGVGVKPLDWPPQKVDVNVSPDMLERMVKRIEHEFLYLGSREPHWSVLTADRFKAENISAHEEEFYASGQQPLASFMAAAARCHVDLSHHQSCFELGCGLGRITMWLGRHFRQVIAGDISAAHLEHARETARRAGLTNVSFLHLNAVGHYRRLPFFDVFFSVIVLQHNPPPLMAHVLEIILGKLAPGGIAYFQIPTYLARYEFSAASYLDSTAPVGDVEVHCVPQAALFEIVERAGCRVLEIREDSALGADAISNTLLLRKNKDVP